MSGKWTPGPWRAVAISGGWDGVEEDKHLGAVICKLSLNNPANALLIAAAPELLEALKGLVYHSDKCAGHRDCAEPVAPLFAAARAVLAKAEGR